MYGFVRRDIHSSVYKAVSKYLLDNDEDWRKLSPNVASFHLMFGERNKLQFGRLGIWFNYKSFMVFLLVLYMFFFYRFNYIFVQHYHFWLFWLRLGKSYIEICFFVVIYAKKLTNSTTISCLDPLSSPGKFDVFHGFMCMFKIFRSWTRANSASELLQRIRCHLQKNCLSKVRGFLAGQGFQFLPLIVSNILIH